MSYEKNTWNTGDVITAEKLNHLENGVADAGGGGGGNFIVHFTDGGLDPETQEQIIIPDKTIEEIIEAKNSGKNVVADVAGMYILPLEMTYEVDDYKVVGFYKMIPAMTGGKLRYLDLMLIEMVKYDEEATNIDVQYYTGNFEDDDSYKPLRVSFYIDSSNNVTCNQDISDIRRALYNNGVVAIATGANGITRTLSINHSEYYTRFYCVLSSGGTDAASDDTELQYHIIDYVNNSWVYTIKTIPFDSATFAS